MPTSLPYGVAPAGFRLPDDTHVGRVQLQVADLQRSVDYYERVVGLRVAGITPNTAVLTAHGDDTVLADLHQKPGVEPAPKRGVFGLYHFAILLPSRDDLGRLIA